MEKIIRISAVLVSAFIFFFAMFYEQDTAISENTPSAPSMKVSVSVQSTEHSETQEQNSAFSDMQTDETYIGSYLNADSANDDLVFPEIDLDKVYSGIIYPVALKRKNIESSFTVRVFVNKEGLISLSFPEGVNSSFIKSIEKAFDGIKATPAVFKGNPTDVTFTIPFEFSLY